MKDQDNEQAKIKTSLGLYSPTKGDPKPLSTKRRKYACKPVNTGVSHEENLQLRCMERENVGAQGHWFWL